MIRPPSVLRYLQRGNVECADAAQFFLVDVVGHGDFDEQGQRPAQAVGIFGVFVERLADPCHRPALCVDLPATKAGDHVGHDSA